jgi:hypothetical protein
MFFLYFYVILFYLHKVCWKQTKLSLLQYWCRGILYCTRLYMWNELQPVNFHHLIIVAKIIMSLAKLLRPCRQYCMWACLVLYLAACLSVCIYIQSSKSCLEWNPKWPDHVFHLTHVLLYSLKIIHASAFINNSHNKTKKCTNVKIIFLHPICHNFDMFQSILIILSMLLNLNKAYIKT